MSSASVNERGHCRSCHQECAQCVGGPRLADCTRCRHYKVYTETLLAHGGSDLIASYNVTGSVTPVSVLYSE